MPKQPTRKPRRDLVAKRTSVDAHWTTNLQNYIYESLVFKGKSLGHTQDFRDCPSAIQLFQTFFSSRTMERICNKTNCYAAAINNKGSLKGGRRWWNLRIQELHSWLEICILLGIKILPNLCAYWQSSVPFLHCHVISSYMTQLRFEGITSYLHVVNDRGFPCRDDPENEKLAKLQWLLSKIRRWCVQNWKPWSKCNHR